MNSNQISKAVRYALVAGAATALAAPAVFAQDASNTNQNQNANTAQLGKIEVTGTRIKRTDVETAQPVTIVTAQQIKQSGLTSIGDVLASLTSVYSTTNLQVNNGGNGSNEINLRNLGTQRVLVLVNGKRWVPNLASAVDLSTIPASIIDHVEILQDGASAIYGSDAIAGVVNIITVKNYNGAEANAFLGIYHGNGHWDGKTQEYDYTVGSSNDKSGVVFNVTYTKQDPVFAGSRNISKEPLVGTGNTAGSSGTPAGRFFIFGPVPCPDGEAGPTCDMTLKTFPAAPSLTNFKGPFSNGDRFNFAPLNYLLVPSETTSLYLQGHYDLADNLTFTTTALYNNRNSTSQLAPEPFFIGSAGAYAIGGVATSPAAHIGISASNPYNPFKTNLTGNSSSSCLAGKGPNAPCDLLVLLGRRMIEQGDRIEQNNQDTFFWSGGLNGYFNAAGTEWDWDVGASFGRQDFTTVDLGSDNILNVANALGPAFPDANVPGGFACGTPANPISGCVPLNLFGGAGSITPAMTNYILAPLHDIALSNQRNYTGNITGDLFNLPAGPVGAAAGVEYLENDGNFQADNLSATGNSSNGVSGSTYGRESTKAQYVEFNIPLVADAPAFKNLSLDIANRWSQFRWEGGTPGTPASTVLNSANASTARAALKWQTTDDLLLRGSWSQGFRLPSVSEFFAPQVSSFLPTSDPCAATRFGGALAPGSVVPKFCPPGTSTSGGVVVGRAQPNSQILNVVGGNPNLTPERSISRTAGFVYNPSWIPGFDFSADYYKIEIVNSISVIGGQNLINDCFFANTNCSHITPNPQIAGNNSLVKPILQIVNLDTNIGATRTSGIDIDTHYKFPSTSVGDFKLGLQASFVKIYDSVVQESANPDTGAVIASGFATSQLAGWAGIPKRRANTALAWNYGNWSATYQLQFVGSQIESCGKNPSPVTFPTLCSYPAGGSTGTQKGADGFLFNTTDPQGFHTESKGTNHIGAGTWTNVEGTYHLDSWNTDFTFGIRNLWDKDPPISISAFANSYNPGLYPTPGRFFYARVGVKF